MGHASNILAGIFVPEHGGSPNADDIAGLYSLMLAMAVVVFVGVESTLIWFMIRFRARKGRVAAQIHGNTRLEIGWTVGAAVILIFITAVTFIKLPAIKNPAASDIDANGNRVASNVAFASTDQQAPPKGASLRIKVDGQQYVWRYGYPSRGGKDLFAYEEMVVPVGMTVILDISSDDVAHSWWIPSLGGKFDALPGYVNHTWFKVPKPGTYEGQCAELCGRGHANMYARVRAVPFSDYEQWAEQTVTDIKTARDEAARERKELTDEQAAAQSGG